MADQHPKDELAGLRRFLAALESGKMRLLAGGKDRTKDEVEILKREIKYLEETLEWLRKHGGQNA